MLRFTFVAMLLVCVASAMAQTKTPQSNVLTDLNFNALKTEIWLSEEVFINSSLESQVRQAIVSFTNLVNDYSSNYPDLELNAGLSFSAPAWRFFGSQYPVPKGLFQFPPEGYRGPDHAFPVMQASGGDFMIHAKAVQMDVMYHMVYDFVALIPDAAIDHIDSLPCWRNILDGHNRDLTGFIDGTVNCPADQRVSQGLIGDEDPVHQNGSFAISQKWIHDLKAFEAMNLTSQEAVFGRTKENSILLDNPLISAHVNRVKQEKFGFFLVRQAIPWGDAASKEVGLFFIAFTKDAHRLDDMCRSMVGHGTYATPSGFYDLVMGISVPKLNNFYYFPSIEMLGSLA